MNWCFAFIFFFKVSIPVMNLVGRPLTNFFLVFFSFSDEIGCSTVDDR